ncbi:unnamed protein product [Cylicocyclus nassatus]|uniref:ZP domain-containing protein n=1 Tax=Cylicocyclus nassatus TaxID=53992 RepID=A0AA36HCY6_CYLNA|nr:unnamed protein product [Cylicocyclus nassatus]
MFLSKIAAVLWTTVMAVKYPNEISETPLVLCEPERIVVKIRTTSSNPSHIYADDFADDPDCSSRNMNKISLRHGKCGMSTERTDNPAGVIQRVCISVQLHPLFVTESDRSYCAQCVYVQSRVLDDLESSLDISEALPTELAPTFDVEKIPKCTYTIRKGSETGPEVRYATVGESVYHVWKCPGENTGILVQNCYVEDGQGNRILVIDQNGCGVDQYVMPTPEYSEDLTTAFQETHVFKFAQKTITRFICQIRICLQSDECKKLSPPSTCPTLEERLMNTKVERSEDEKPFQRAKDQKPFPVDDSRSSKETAPPSAQPVQDIKRNANATLGSIYFGYSYDSTRSRRELSEPRVSTTKGYPEVDLVGEIRVLDSPEDVMYFERKASAIQGECVSKVAYSLVVAALVIVSILFIMMVLVIVFKTTNYRNKIIRFEN